MMYNKIEKQINLKKILKSTQITKNKNKKMTFKINTN